MKDSTEILRNPCCLIGASKGSREWKQLINETGEPRLVIGSRIAQIYTVLRSALQIQFYMGKIDALVYLGVGAEDYSAIGVDFSPFDGPLPAGISMDDTPDKVRTKLGEPLRIELIKRARQLSGVESDEQFRLEMQELQMSPKSLRSELYRFKEIYLVDCIFDIQKNDSLILVSLSSSVNAADS